MGRKKRESGSPDDTELLVASPRPDPALPGRRPERRTAKNHGRGNVSKRIKGDLETVKAEPVVHHSWKPEDGGEPPYPLPKGRPIPDRPVSGPGARSPWCEHMVWLEERPIPENPNRERHKGFYVYVEETDVLRQMREDEPYLSLFRRCPECGRSYNVIISYFNVGNRFSPLVHGRCKYHVTKGIVPDDESTFVPLLESIDVAYIPDLWVSVANGVWAAKGMDRFSGSGVFGKYLQALFISNAYRDYTFAESDSAAKKFAYLHEGQEFVQKWPKGHAVRVYRENDIGVPTTNRKFATKDSLAEYGEL